MGSEMKDQQTAGFKRFSFKKKARKGYPQKTLTRSKHQFLCQIVVAAGPASNVTQMTQKLSMLAEVDH